MLGKPTATELLTAAQIESNFLDSADSALWEIESRHVVKEIVVPVDGTTHSQNSLMIAHKVAESIIATVFPVQVIKNEDDETVQGAEAVSISSRESVAKTIVQFADLIVMGTRALTGPQSLTSRSVTAGVIQNADCPVLVIPSKWEIPEKITRPERMMVALDGSKSSERSLSFAVNIAKNFDTQITLLHVPKTTADIASKTAYLKGIQSFLQSQGISSSVLVEGIDPVESIPAIAKDLEIDLLFLTTRGLSGFSKMLVGSITDNVIRNVDIPTVVVPMVED